MSIVEKLNLSDLKLKILHQSFKCLKSFYRKNLCKKSEALLHAQESFAIITHEWRVLGVTCKLA